jgi:hypothetical protein
MLKDLLTGRLALGPVVFLCSAAASSVTGAIPAVDGGFLAV